MKKVIVLLLVIALMLPLIAADTPPKPPKVLRLTIVNRAGEDVRVSLTGLGYDFRTGEFVGDWGIIGPQFYSTVAPGTITRVLPNKQTVVIKLKQHITYMDVLRDLYILNLQYNREIVPEGTSNAAVICLNTWTPASMYGNPTYFAVKGGNAKLIIKPCNQVPANLGAPDEGVLKYNRFMILLATSGYNLK
jgi:hypothetical protein